jgi:hypothetical protein
MLTKTVALAASAIGIAASSASASHADPPKFPDLNSYAPVNSADYALMYPNSGRPTTLDVTTFLTPDGVVCAFGNPPSAGCTSDKLPGMPPASPSSSGSPRVNAISTVAGPHPTSEKSNAEGLTVKTLAPFTPFPLTE